MAEIEKLFDEHYGFIFKYILSLCHNESLAEELTQETFFRAYINIKSLRNDAKAAAWLCSIAKNLYFSWYNENKKFTGLEEAEEISDKADIAEKVATKELVEAVYRHLCELEEPYREVFMLAVLGDVSLTDISKAFQKSESWARVTFYRAKQKILEKMR